MALSSDHLAAELREKIRTGALLAGAKLPSVRVLADERGVGRGVAQQAINKLLAEGLVVSRHGAGTYVREEDARYVRRAPEDITTTQLGKGDRSVVLRIDEVPAPDSVADNFRVERGTPVVLRYTKVLHGERPVQLVHAYYPVDLVRGTPIAYHDPGDGGVYARLVEQKAGVTRFHERVKGRAPSPEEADELNLRVGSAMVLEIVRLGLSKNRVVEVARLVLDASATEVWYEFPA